jgi:Ca2+-binding EF-hand superfamily protein
MFRTLLSIVVAVSIASVSLAQTAAPKTDEKAPAAKKAPAKKPAYDPVAEKAKFFKIAGKDTEVDAKEFAAALAKVGDKGEGFVRKTDRWSSLLRYDKNNNKKIDWFEADAFRKQARTGRRDSGRRGREMDPATIKKYDKNGDGQLTGDERSAARSARFEEMRKEFLKENDADGDGKLSDEERRAGFRKRMESMRRRWAERRYDKDGDGKLNDEEKAAMEKGEAARAAERKKRTEEYIKKYDKNGDGKVEGDERRAVGEDMRRRWTERRYDKDRDGKLSDEEKAAMEKGEAARAAERKKRTEEYIKRYDKNGDGKVDDKERPQRRGFWGRRRRGGDNNRGATGEE